MPIEDYETIISSDLVRLTKNEGALKIIVNLDDEETLKTIENILTQDLYYTIANGHLMQIMNKAATKWNGIKAMVDYITESNGADGVAKFIELNM